MPSNGNWDPGWVDYLTSLGVFPGALDSLNITATDLNEIIERRHRERKTSEQSQPHRQAIQDRRVLLEQLDKVPVIMREQDLDIKLQQQLIDLMFEVAIKAYGWAKTNPDVTNEQIATWVKDAALRDSGFNVEPRGSSWGILDPKQPYLNDSNEGIEIVSASRPD